MSLRIDTLNVLAQMDGEAAIAYNTAATLVHLPEMKVRLMDFAHEHLDHIKALRQMIQLLGGELTDAPGPECSTFSKLTAGIGPLGTQGALLSLIAMEQFTNAAYDTVRRLVVEQAALALERNFRNEQRHIEWLSAQVRKVGLG